MRGNITKRGKHSWQIKFDLDRDSSGERKTRFVTIKGTRKQAEAELALNDANKGVLIDATKLTVAAHLHAWLGRKGDLSPLSRQRYAEVIEAHIIPTLGVIELQKLKPADIQAWLVTMRDGKRGQRTARTIIHSFRVLRAALKAAVRQNS